MPQSSKREQELDRALFGDTAAVEQPPASVATGASPNPPPMNRLAGGFLETNPVSQLWRAAQPPQSGEVGAWFGPGGRMVEGLLRGMYGKLEEAWKAGRDGKPLSAITKAAEATPAGQILNPVTRRVGQGDYAGATGAGLGIASNALLPDAVGAAPRALGAAAAGVKAAAPDIAMGSIKAGTGAGIGSLAGTVPGVGHLASWVFAYPGVRQIARGVGEGAKAFTEKFRGASGVLQADPTLEGIAKGEWHKPFAQLTPAEQAVAQEMARRASPTQLPANRPAPTTAAIARGTATDEPKAVPGPKTIEDALKQFVRENKTTESPKPLADAVATDTPKALKGRMDDELMNILAAAQEKQVGREQLIRDLQNFSRRAKRAGVTVKNLSEAIDFLEKQ